MFHPKKKRKETCRTTWHVAHGHVVRGAWHVARVMMRTDDDVPDDIDSSNTKVPGAGTWYRLRTYISAARRKWAAGRPIII